MRRAPPQGYLDWAPARTPALPSVISPPRQEPRADGAGLAVPTNDPHMSVAICAYTDRRWALLVDAVEHVDAQLHEGDEVFIVIDHSPALLDRVRTISPPSGRRKPPQEGTVGRTEHGR